MFSSTSPSTSAMSRRRRLGAAAAPRLRQPEPLHLHGAVRLGSVPRVALHLRRLGPGRLSCRISSAPAASCSGATTRPSPASSTRRPRPPRSAAATRLVVVDPRHVVRRIPRRGQVGGDRVAEDRALLGGAGRARLPAAAGVRGAAHQPPLPARPRAALPAGSHLREVAVVLRDPEPQPAEPAPPCAGSAGRAASRDRPRPRHRRGDWVRIVTPHGTVRARARLTPPSTPTSSAASTAGGNPAATRPVRLSGVRPGQRQPEPDAAAGAQ